MKIQQESTNIDQDIQKIFNAATLSDKMNTKGRHKAKQLMMNNIKNIISESLKRSLYRDGQSNYVQMKDLLAVVQKKGDIYKFKLARTIIMSKFTKDHNQKGDQKYSINYGASSQFDHHQIQEN